MKRIHLLWLPLCALGLSGCGKSPEESAGSGAPPSAQGQAQQAPGSAEVSVAEDKAVVRTDKGKVELAYGEDVGIPGDFPGDVFVYTPSKTLMSGQSEEGRTLVLLAQDSIDEVASSYRSEMKSRGWASQMSMDMGPQTILVFQKGERMATVAIMPADNGAGTQIMITLGEG